MCNWSLNYNMLYFYHRFPHALLTRRQRDDPQQTKQKVNRKRVFDTNYHLSCIWGKLLAAAFSWASVAPHEIIAGRHA